MNLLRRFKKWLIGLFTLKYTKLLDLEATPEVQISRQPGLNCPECTTRIPISIQILLNSGSVTCPGCSLSLEIDRQQSEGALHALQKLQNGLDAARRSR